MLFGNRLHLAERYAARLTGDGVLRGLIGPREAGRIWERHLLNSAILTELLPADARVVDVGSGAGLPGIPMAVRRPDLHIDLVEPMQRRVTFLSEVVAELGFERSVQIVRGRADDAEVVRRVGRTDWVVARAVAPLDRLVRWCLPLLSAHGRLLAMKGAGGIHEAAEHEQAVRRLGARVVALEQLGEKTLGEGTWVVVVERDGRALAGER